MNITFLYTSLSFHVTPLHNLLLKSWYRIKKIYYNRRYELKQSMYRFVN